MPRTSAARPIELSGKQAGEDVDRHDEAVRVGTGPDRQRPGPARSRRPLARSPGGRALAWGFVWAMSSWDDQKTSPLMADEIHVSNLDHDRYREIKTDATGRMTFPTLIPGAIYRIIVYNQKQKTEIEFTVEPGEAKDLGDLKILNLEQRGLRP